MKIIRIKQRKQHKNLTKPKILKAIPMIDKAYIQSRPSIFNFPSIKNMLNRSVI